MRVTALQQEFVLYRLPNGQTQVLSDLCVHRGGALSDGWLTGECIVCPYHGWEFDITGRCTFQPAQPELTPPAIAALTAPRPSMIRPSR